MSDSLLAIKDGLDYQALWFWFLACRLLRRNSELIKVGFEVGEYKSFDDVAVHFTETIPDGNGSRIAGEFYSIKHSITFGKEIDVDTLIDPRAINASKHCLLRRLSDAVGSMTSEGNVYNFKLLAPWGLSSEMRELVETGSGKLRLKQIFNGSGARSKAGQLRAKWRDAIGATSDDEIQKVLSRLRIEPNVQTVDSHIDELNIRLELAGLLTIDRSKYAGCRYFDFIWALRRTGKSWFVKEELAKLCLEEELVAPALSEALPTRIQIGIRSFLRFAENLDEEVDQVLCLVAHFAGRAPLSGETWRSIVPVKIKDFLREHIEQNRAYEFNLQCHGSVAFLVGYLLEPKFCLSTAINQRQYGKAPETWELERDSGGNSRDVASVSVSHVGAGSEWALAMSITQEIEPAVIAYCRANLPDVGKILVIRPNNGPSQRSVQSGGHAFKLAEAAATAVTLQATPRTGNLHLFWAAPNAFAFLFGQVARPLGQCLLYEFDFDGAQVYSPSVAVAPDYRIE